jgi:uncharacterized protein (DUF488 family)
MNPSDPILTIGHSNHPLWRFLELLQAHGVETVGDVRSVPYSRRYPVYNRETLDRELRSHGIEYVFLGAQLGARPDDPACYEGRRASYRRIAESPLFRSGLERAISLAQSRRLALLCAEKEPLDCHRALLVSRELKARGVLVSHILAEASLEAHDATESRLLDEGGFRQFGLFKPDQNLVDEAYARMEELRAFTRPSDADGDSGAERD